MINRHNFTINDLNGDIIQHNRMINANLEMLEKGSVSNLSSFSGHCITGFFLRQFDEEQGGKYREKFRWTKREYLELALKAKLAYYDLVMSPGEKRTVELGGVEYIFIGEISKRGIGNGSWVSLWNRAHILRDKAAIERLLEIPESLMRTDNLQGDEYHFLYVDFLKSLYLDPSNAPEKLKKVYEATDPSVLKVEEPVYALNHTVPMLDIFIAILSKDEDAFNKGISEALKCGKYMISREKNQENNVSALYDMDVLALCAIGIDNGFKVTVESPYIPNEIYTGSF